MPWIREDLTFKQTVAAAALTVLLMSPAALHLSLALAPTLPPRELLTAALGLGVLIIVAHEAGHWAAARALGYRVRLALLCRRSALAVAPLGVLGRAEYFFVMLAPLLAVPMVLALALLAAPADVAAAVALLYASASGGDLAGVADFVRRGLLGYMFREEGGELATYINTPSADR